MGKIGNTRYERVKKRLKSRKKRSFSIFFIILTIILYFSFASNISVDEKTGKVIIVKKKEIKKEKFEEVYTGAVFKGLPFDIDIDVKNVYLTGTKIELSFSNNPDFILNKPYKSDNFNKIRYGFMLGKVRNRDKVFWLGKNLDSLNKIEFKLNDVIEDDELGFKVANLEGATLFVRLVIKGEKIIK